MKQFWVTFFGSIVGVVVGSVLTVIVVFLMIGAMINSAMEGAQRETALPHDGIVLELDLRTPRLDSPSRSPFAFAEPLSVVDIVQTLERAEDDARVQGVFIRANEFGLSPGMAEEMRNAIADFREAGKFVITHAQGFEGTSVTGYFAVSGSDEIWLQDTASFTPAGLASEVMFLGGLFEHFNAEPQFEQFHEYKNAANTYTQTGFTDAHREAAESYLGSIYDTAVAAIAGDRGDGGVIDGAQIGFGRFAVRVGETGLGVGVGGVLVLVELLELRFRIEVLEQSAEEHHLGGQAGRREGCRVLQPDLVRPGNREIAGDAGAFETLGVGDHELAGFAEVGDRIAHLLGHARRQAEFIGADENTLDAGIVFGAFQGLDDVDDRERFGKGEGRARRAVEPRRAQIQFQDNAVMGKGGLALGAFHGGVDHGADHEEDDDDSEDRADDDADNRSEERYPELFHGSPFDPRRHTEAPQCKMRSPFAP